MVKKLLAFVLALSLVASGVTLPAVSVQASVSDESILMEETAKSVPGSESIVSVISESSEETAAESEEPAPATDESADK
ncbi:MAG: hypothetical protein VZR35_06310, partial [Lachnospiraceae bacterium]|nr:hypothetical protein [Lachnospiraceae bacterium]